MCVCVCVCPIGKGVFISGEVSDIFCVYVLVVVCSNKLIICCESGEKLL